jgi:hypothetical protein
MRRMDEIADLEPYPLFIPAAIELRELIPADRQARVGVSVIVSARKPR